MLPPETPIVSLADQKPSHTAPEVRPTLIARCCYATPLLLLFILLLKAFDLAPDWDQFFASAGMKLPVIPSLLLQLRTWCLSMPWLLPASIFVVFWLYFAFACKTQRRMRMFGIGLLLSILLLSGLTVIQLTTSTAHFLDQLGR